MLFQKNIDKAFTLQQKLNRERRGEDESAARPAEPVEGESAVREEQETPLPPQLLERQKEEKLTFKDKLAMLLSAYAVLLVPAVLVLCLLCLLLYWIAGGF